MLLPSCTVEILEPFFLEFGTLTCPNVSAVQWAIEQREGENFPDEIIFFLHQEVPENHTDTHQKLQQDSVK